MSVRSWKGSSGWYRYCSISSASALTSGQTAVCLYPSTPVVQVLTADLNTGERSITGLEDVELGTAPATLQTCTRLSGRLSFVPDASVLPDFPESPALVWQSSAETDLASGFSARGITQHWYIDPLLSPPPMPQSVWYRIETTFGFRGNHNVALRRAEMYASYLKFCASKLGIHDTSGGDDITIFYARPAFVTSLTGAVWSSNPADIPPGRVCHGLTPRPYHLLHRLGLQSYTGPSHAAHFGHDGAPLPWSPVSSHASRDDSSPDALPHGPARSGCTGSG
jgi:hypothetical protein